MNINYKNILESTKKKRIVISTLLVLMVVLSATFVNIDFKNPVKIDDGNLKIGTFLNITIGTDEAYASITPDYTTDGVADDVQFQAALNALPATGGKLTVLAGTYNFTALTTVTRAINNITIEGVGQASYFTCDGVTPIFTAGGNNWIFKDLRTDAGGITMGATTGWQWNYVNDGTNLYKYRDEYTSIIGNTLATTAINTGGKLTAGANEIEGSNFDINGGTISGGLTWSSAQDLNNQALTNVNIDSGSIGPFTLTGTINMGANYLDLNTSGSGTGIRVTNTSTGVTGAVLTLYQSSLSPANNDYPAYIEFKGKDSDSNEQPYGQFTCQATNVASGSENGKFLWANVNGGAWAVNTMSLDHDGTLWILGGLIQGSGYHQLTEMAAPGAGAANTARIYALEGGDTLTDLVAVFQDGSTDVFAQETTELDANVFRYPDSTEVKVELRKDHRGEIRFVAVFPDGTTYNLEHHEYHTQEYIDANMGTVSDSLPDGWEMYDLVN